MPKSIRRNDGRYHLSRPDGRSLLRFRQRQLQGLMIVLAQLDDLRVGGGSRNLGRARGQLGRYFVFPGWDRRNRELAVLIGDALRTAHLVGRLGLAPHANFRCVRASLVIRRLGFGPETNLRADDGFVVLGHGAVELSAN